MLDKSIPYKHVIMRLNNNNYTGEPSLPEGFSFRFFRKGDEHHWARLETSDHDYQGLGLGKAIVVKVLNLFTEFEPEERIWLHTQTWSSVAIRLYHCLGFNMLKSESTAVEIGGDTPGPVISKNDYEEALDVLKDVFDDKFLAKLIETSE